MLAAHQWYGHDSGNNKMAGEEIDFYKQYLINPLSEGSPNPFSNKEDFKVNAIARQFFLRVLYFLWFDKKMKFQHLTWP